MRASRPENTEHLRYIAPLCVGIEAMEAADVEGNVKRAFERIQVSHVTYNEFRLNIVLGDSLPRFCDCDCGKVDSCRSQSLLRKIARESAYSASQLQRTPGSFMLYQ